MTAFFSDTFTDTNGTALNSHTPDTGTSWSLLYQDADKRYEIQSNTAEQVNGLNGGAFYTADATYPSADYSVQFTLSGLPANSAQNIFVMARIADIDNLYAVRITSNNPQDSQIYRKLSGTWTALGSKFNQPGASSVMRFEVVGDSLEVYDDDVLVASATDTNITAAGKAGIGGGGGAEGISAGIDMNSACSVDAFSVTDLGSAATAAPAIFFGCNF